MQHKQLVTFCENVLENLKALDIKTLNVSNLTDVTDTIIICSGTSNRHVKSLSEKLTYSIKEVGLKPLGVEGGDQADWVLVDLGEVIIHVMLSKTRDFYDLESLWEYNEANVSNLSA